MCPGGGIEEGETDVVVGMVGGEGPGGVADGSIADGGVAGADSGERSSLLSSSWSRSSSASFRCRRVLLAGSG